MEAKGKPGGVPGRRLVRALSLMRPRGVRGMPHAFVGREVELAQLQSTYHGRDGGKSAAVSPSSAIPGWGRPGCCASCRSGWPRSPRPLCHRTGRCLSYGQGTTYWPLAEVLKEHYGIRDSDSVGAIELALTERPFLGLTLGISSGEDLHPLAARERLHDSWVEFIDSLAAERPVVILVEDLHWAEDDLCDLLETLVAQVEGPLLLITTARPELLDRRPGWGAGARADIPTHARGAPARGEPDSFWTRC